MGGTDLARFMPAVTEALLGPSNPKLSTDGKTPWRIDRDPADRDRTGSTSGCLPLA